MKIEDLVKAIQIAGFPCDARRVGDNIVARINARYFAGWGESVTDITIQMNQGVTIGTAFVTRANFRNFPKLGTYWMVNKPGTASRFMHTTREDAEAEARRLTLTFGGPFYVGEFNV